MIDLGTNRTIDSYKLKSDSKNLRIIFYDQDTGWIDSLETNVGNGRTDEASKGKKSGSC